MDFSLFFTQLSVGLVGLLPVVPWRSVGRGYCVMMLVLGLAFLPVAWFFRGGTLPWAFAAYGVLGLAALSAFLAGRGGAGAALAAGAALLGVLALLLDGARASTLARDPALHLAHPAGAVAPLVAFNFLASALLLGTVLSAMLLGHWYLVVKDLPVKPLKDMTLLFFGALGARIAATVGAFLLDPAGGRAVADRSFLFVLVYGLFSLGCPLGMSWMIWGTVKIRSTQAATGILYGVCAFILMGEASGRFVFLKTGFPL